MTIVSTSGGQDSTTCLLWAIKIFGHSAIRTVFFNYGQRNVEVEREAAIAIAQHLAVPYYIIDLQQAFAGLQSKSALLDPEAKVVMDPVNNLPTSFVPGRNIILLSMAAALAYNLEPANGKINVVTGVCQQDSQGYPDCRERPIIDLGKTLSGGLEKDVSILTPLMHKNKAQTVKMFYEMPYGTDELMSLTHTCYYGHKGGCNECPACIQRVKGFVDAGRVDPCIALREVVGL